MRIIDQRRIAEKGDLHTRMLDDAHRVIISFGVSADHRDWKRIKIFDGVDIARRPFIEHMVICDIEYVKPRINQRLDHLPRRIEIRIARNAEIRAANRRFLIDKSNVRRRDQFSNPRKNLRKIIFLSARCKRRGRRHNRIVRNIIPRRSHTNARFSTGRR